MKKYPHILLALDFSRHGIQVAAKAKELARLYQARLSVLHVLDNIAMPDTAYGTEIELARDDDETFLAAEKQRMLQFAKNQAIDSGDLAMIWGNPKQEIVNYAKTRQVDLIVLGSHGRHGVALLLGSTANSVLHHAKCDVMAVRLRED